jgi:flagellar motor switch protein FliN/FliY
MASEDKPDEAADDGMADWAEALLEQKATDGGGDAPSGGVLTGDAPRPFTNSDGTTADINMVLDIPVQLSVELGRTKVPIKHILQLGQGSVVELDALAGEPMDVLVNGYLIAQGEVVVVNDKFGIRLTDVVTPSERLRRVSRN